MEEKIRVNITKKIQDMIHKDAENFEFYKKDGSINKNAFMNNLVLNYYEEFEENKKSMFTSIVKYTKDKLSEDEIESLCFTLMKTNIGNSTDKKNKETFISFRPTKETSYICEYIESCLLKNISRSSYYRQMLESYFSLPQDRREQIIFKDKMELIQKAIKQKKKIYILSKNNYLNNRPGFILNPYCISTTKEELYNYVLGEVQGSSVARTMRLCRMENIKILNETCEIDASCLKVLKKMVLYGPQYAYGFNEEELVYVRLTPKGIDKFKSMYVHRPIPVDIQDNMYIFDCSYDQIFQYFSRFGSNAYIVSPSSLQKQMKQFHQYALRSYRNKEE